MNKKQKTKKIFNRKKFLLNSMLKYLIIFLPLLFYRIPIRVCYIYNNIYNTKLVIQKVLFKDGALNT